VVDVSLAPIPARMLHDTVVFSVPTGMDRYQNKTYDTYTVNHVHLQSESAISKGPDNTEVLLRGILFVDARRSTPVLDLYALQKQALEAGDTMRAVVTDASGAEIGDYAVLVVDDLPDVPATRRHHWELGLV
jgi:phage protein U